MPYFDFSAPFVTARLIDHAGEVYPLWTNSGSTDNQQIASALRSDVRALAFLQEVQVSLNLGMIPKISLQLAPPFHDGMALINSHLLNSALRNRVEVQFGYVRGTSDGRPILSPVFTGLIENPEVNIDVEMQITLTAQVPGQVIQPGRATAREGETRQDLIIRIARGAGRSLKVNFTDALADSVCRGLLTAPAGTYLQGGRSDWVALYELAHQTRCWLNVIGDTVYWVSRPRRLMGSPTRRYHLYNIPKGQLRGATNDVLQTKGAGDFPILSFSCATQAVWLPANQFGVNLRDIGEHTREANRQLVTHADIREPASGDGAQTVQPSENMPFDENTGQGAGELPGDPDNEGARQGAEQEVNGANLGVEVDIETIGDPEIIPGTIVRIQGLGRRFDNRVYAVHEVAHTVGMGGFSTQLKLITNIDALINEISGGRPAEGPVPPPQVLENALNDTGGGGATVTPEIEDQR